MKCKKIFLGLVLGIALLMGILVLVLPQEHLEYLVFASRFFEAMLPVLAVGALLKYICCCSSAKCCCADKSACCDTKEKGSCG